MTFTFRKAVRGNETLIIGVAGPSGGGKTYTAMRLARGIAGDKPFAVIDTENGRAKHYADQFDFEHCDFEPPFTPDRYLEALLAADAMGVPVIVVDSMSHEHAGDGGLLDMQEDELQRMAGEDWRKRKACTMAAWIKPKRSHKKMVEKMLRLNAHVILCFRAENKVEMVEDRGETVVRPKKSLAGHEGWIPVCEKNLPYEATVSFMLTGDPPGLPHFIKLQEQHKPIFPEGSLIDEEAGRRLAEWAKGGKVELAAPKPAVSPQRVQKMVAEFAKLGVGEDALCAFIGHPLDTISADEFKALGAEYKRRAAQPRDEPSEAELAAMKANAEAEEND